MSSPLPIVLLLIIGGLVLLTQFRRPVEPGTATADLLAYSMLIQHAAAVRAAQANGSLTGVISTSSMSLPGGYQPAAPWISRVDGAFVTTWWTGEDGGSVSRLDLAAAAARATRGTVVTGIAASSAVARPQGGSVPVPSSVPAGAVVAMTQVRG